MTESIHHIIPYELNFTKIFGKTKLQRNINQTVKIFTDSTMWQERVKIAYSVLHNSGTDDKHTTSKIHGEREASITKSPGRTFSKTKSPPSEVEVCFTTWSAFFSASCTPWGPVDWPRLTTFNKKQVQVQQMFRPKSQRRLHRLPASRSTL